MCDVKYYVFQCLKDEKCEHWTREQSRYTLLTELIKVKKEGILSTNVKPELIHRPAF